MIRKYALMLLLLFLFFSSHSNATVKIKGKQGQKVVITTAHTALVYLVDSNSQLQQIYLGTKLSSPSLYRDVNADFRNENPTLGMGFPTGGATYLNEPAMEVGHADGNMSLVLNVQQVETKKINDNITQTEIIMKDPAYPFWVSLHFDSYYKEDIISTWTTIHHNEQGNVTLDRFASAFININWDKTYLTHFYGEYEKEMEMNTAKLQPGIFSIQSKLGVRTACNYNPSFFISPNATVGENDGEVFAGTLAYSGNFNIQFEQLKLNIDMGNSLRIIPGINAYASHYPLKAGQTFTTPKFIFSYTQKGLGQISRNFHHWAVDYGIYNGHQKGLTLLNNWEATYFDYDQDKLVKLFDGAKKLGVDLFLLDDGWFGNQYPRNSSNAGLGDWQANKKKLPDGIGYLDRQATAKGLKFGVWIEPEMVNPSSQLYKQHPDWVLAAPNRPLHLYRTQLVLDLINPAVQDFVFGVIDSLMKQAPSISYMKWDCNRSMDNAFSPYLGKNQAGLYIKYTEAYYKVLDRIRSKYPNLQMMLCASGGGRVEYGALKYFQEFWPSDNTYPVDRIRLQWATSIFYPALTICNHVTAAGRESLKYKMDVAMSGKLGFDVDVDKMSESDLELARKTVDNYHKYQSVINYGDLYRLISPYSTNFSSLMYVDSTKSKAVLFAYSMETMGQDSWPVWHLTGLDPHKNYRIHEINLPSDGSPHFKQDGQIFSGETLISQGLKWFLKHKEQSAVLVLEAV